MSLPVGEAPFLHFKAYLHRGASPPGAFLKKLPWCRGRYSVAQPTTIRLQVDPHQPVGVRPPSHLPRQPGQQLNDADTV